VSVYVPADLQRAVRAKFANCCAYCHTAEELTAVTFEKPETDQSSCHVRERPRLLVPIHTFGWKAPPLLVE
jgi:hypothetical protein